jgi:hypothetical protein
MGNKLRVRLGSGSFTKQIRGMMKLPPYHFSVIMGLLLSDAWVSFASYTTLNARLGFKQSLAHSEYLWLVFFILAPYCSSYPRFIKSSINGTQFYALEFQTRSLPCFTVLHSLFYVNKVKVIPDNIYAFLSPIALAHLIMGDGSVSKHGLVLCTNCYTLSDVVRLMNVLVIRYRLECTLWSDKRNNDKIASRR